MIVPLACMILACIALDAVIFTRVMYPSTPTAR